MTKQMSLQMLSIHVVFHTVNIRFSTTWSHRKSSHRAHAQIRSLVTVIKNSTHLPDPRAPRPIRAGGRLVGGSLVGRYVTKQEPAGFFKVSGEESDFSPCRPDIWSRCRFSVPESDDLNGVDKKVDTTGILNIKVQIQSRPRTEIWRESTVKIRFFSGWFFCVLHIYWLNVFLICI